jgi:hypothetical protein
MMITDAPAIGMPALSVTLPVRIHPWRCPDRTPVSSTIAEMTNDNFLTISSIFKFNIDKSKGVQTSRK